MPRQGKNIYRRKDGRWEGRYSKGKINGKYRYGSVFGKTYDEVEQKLDAMKSENSNISAVSEVLFEDIALEWLSVQQPELKVSSYSKYRNLLKSYLIPEFGKFSIQSISRGEVSKFSRMMLIEGGMRKKGLSPKTVNSMLSVLKNVLDYASREKGLTVADIGDVSVRQKQKPMRILSRSEQETLNRYLCAKLNPSNLGILLCLYTGMRIGEICALKWGDIFIEEQYLFVHQSMQRIQRSGEAEKKTEIVIQSPKSDCSIRRIPLPYEVLQLLISVRKPDEAFLLTGMTYSFMEPRCMENQFKSVMKTCGIPNMNFHALRHTFATRCVELGFDIKSLSEILGHASVNITLNRYVHPSMELKQENMNLLSSILTTN